MEASSLPTLVAKPINYSVEVRTDGPLTSPDDSYGHFGMTNRNKSKPWCPFIKVSLSSGPPIAATYPTLSGSIITPSNPRGQHIVIFDLFPPKAGTRIDSWMRRMSPPPFGSCGLDLSYLLWVSRKIVVSGPYLADGYGSIGSSPNSEDIL